jgi:SAM-dependent methyltransferase
VTLWPEGGGAEYAARFRALAASGKDLHGEASFCAALIEPGSRVLDAGCGTGRVAIELARRGYRCVGVDSDASMLAEAERDAPDLRWVQADLAGLEALHEDLGDDPAGFDLVVCAGNVVPLIAPERAAEAVHAMADQLRPAGFLVCGFGLDRAHLPRSAQVVALETFDRWCDEAGLTLEARYATWDAQPWPGSGGYAVSVLRRR